MHCLEGRRRTVYDRCPHRPKMNDIEKGKLLIYSFIHRVTFLSLLCRPTYGLMDDCVCSILFVFCGNFVFVDSDKLLYLLYDSMTLRVFASLL